MISLHSLFTQTKNVRIRSFCSLSFPPGLLYIKDFLREDEIQSLLEESLTLKEKITKSRENAKSYESKGHNLPFERHYKLIHFEDIANRKITGQSFINYGDNGHELCYFINNSNVPNFIHDKLIKKVSSIEHIKTLSENNAFPLNWRFTFNTYSEQNSGKRGGFGWHKDIDVNGEITSITSIVGKGTFEIRESPSDINPLSIDLIPGSILLLSGASRWEWEHRVIPETCGSQDRISLVLGCVRSNKE